MPNPHSDDSAVCVWKRTVEHNFDKNGVYIWRIPGCRKGFKTRITWDSDDCLYCGKPISESEEG